MNKFFQTKPNYGFLIITLLSNKFKQMNKLEHDLQETRIFIHYQILHTNLKICIQLNHLIHF